MRNQLVIILFILCNCLPQVIFAASEKPNVVIIYGDDVGFGDVGVYGSENTDSAHRCSRGMVYAYGCPLPSSNLQPFAVLNAYRNIQLPCECSYISSQCALAIPVDTYTLADLFKEAGYLTAVIGKWHLGLGSRVLLPIGMV